MKNQISNTLFRFVSLRSPELSEAEARTAYVHEPGNLQRGLFFEAVENLTDKTKAQALQEAAGRFDAFASEDSLRQLSPDLYEFCIWLSRNKSTLDYRELEDKLQGKQPLNEDSEGELQQVWDNLFYQIITQKSFYLKERLMQLLLANHVIKLWDANLPEKNKMLVKAKVAIPEELFSGYTVIATDEKDQDPEKLTPVIADRAMQRELMVSKAQISNNDCNVLKKELEQLEKNYRKDYETSYDAAYKRYQEDIAPSLERYNQDLEDARKNYCSTSYTPGVEYNPNDPCQQPDYVPYPTLPEFNFEFNKEIDPEELRNKLSYESYGTLLDVLGYKFENTNYNKTVQQNPKSADSLIASHDTYSSIYREIDLKVEDNNKIIIDNTPLPNRELVIGGIRIPAVTIDTSVLHINKFTFCGTRSGIKSSYALRVALPETLDVVSIEVHQHNADQSSDSFTVFSPKSSRKGSMIQFNDLLSHVFKDEKIADGPVYDLDLKLSDESVREIKGLDSVSTLSHCLSGELLHNGVLPPKLNPFKPSGFGLKEIGVADYLRVEQSVHCYVEGEVSHIENVMAREYKEKSTRRLVRSEDTTTTSNETEREQLTDTTTADRFEMQTEVSKVIQQSQQQSGMVNSGFNKAGFFVNAGLSFANDSAREDSIRQAQMQAKEITEQALDRVVTKVKEERVRKITEEFEENYKHGFDNRRGSQHVVGVYRWIDKLYKNQIYNYGSRMMFEFMIPEPAKLHILGMQEELQTGNTVELTKPLDPRRATGLFKMSSYTDVSETTAAYWAGIYNAEIQPKPEQSIYIGKSFSYAKPGNPEDGWNEHSHDAVEIDIPEGYYTKNCSYRVAAKTDGDSTQIHAVSITIGNIADQIYRNHHLDIPSSASDNTLKGTNVAINAYQNKIPVSYSMINYPSVSIGISIKAELSTEALNQWQQETFKTIMDAYYEALAEYNRKTQEQDAVVVEVKRTNPGFFRQIENTILRKNCISYLINRNPGAVNTYGKNLGNGVNTFSGYEVNLNSTLDNYASYVKFIEQAFEWDIISYNFYPFYWGAKNTWADKYRFDETDDPIFREFIQSGMARVIATVRPGFEQAVCLYLETGMIWNGGETPVINDPLYVSIIDEVTGGSNNERPTVNKYGKAWISRVPTALTILQAKSIGLDVGDKALPCNCDDVEDFENPEEVPCSEAFEVNDNVIGGDDGPVEPVE